MTMRCLRTVHRDGYWLNVIDGQVRPSSQHEYQGEAMARGRALAEARGYAYVVEAHEEALGDRLPVERPLVTDYARS